MHARPSPERPVSAQGGLGFKCLNASQQVPLRILYGVSVCTYVEDYLLVSSHLVPSFGGPEEI